MPEETEPDGSWLSGRKFIVLTSIKGKRIRTAQFDNFADAMSWAKDENRVSNVYWTVNPAKDVSAKIAAGKRPSSDDIESVFAFKLDIDPIRPKGLSATDAEKAATKEKVLVPLFNFLVTHLGNPMIVDSGNGFNVLIRLDPMGAPTKEFQTLSETLMDFLSEKFSVEDVGKVDTSVSDLPRVLAFPNTLKMKGENTSARPHRMVSLVGLGNLVPLVKFISFVERISRVWEYSNRKYVVGLPRFAEFHNGKLSLVARLKKEGISRERVLAILNSFVWLRGDPTWDMDEEERDNETMVDDTFDLKDDELSTKHLTIEEKKVIGDARIQEDIETNSPRLITKESVAEQVAEVNPVEHRIWSFPDLKEKYKGYKIPWVLKPFLARGEVTLLAAGPKVGKTTLALQCAHRITTGLPWEFSKTKKRVRGAVLYYSLETSAAVLVARIRALVEATALMDFPPNFFVVAPEMTTGLNWEQILKDVVQTKAAVVIIDNILGADLKADINKAEEVAKIMNTAYDLARGANVSVMLIHHTRKGQRMDLLIKDIKAGTAEVSMDDVSGSRMFTARAAIVVQLTNMGKRERRISVNSRLGVGAEIKAIFDKRGYLRKSQKSDEEEHNLDNDNIDEEDDGTICIPVLSGTDETTSQARIRNNTEGDENAESDEKSGAQEPPKLPKSGVQEPPKSRITMTPLKRKDVDETPV